MQSIGKMRHRLELQKATNTTDAGGGMTQSYNTINIIYGAITPKSGNEKYRQGMVQESTTHEIMIRFVKNISTKYRIKFENRVFNIKNIQNVEERDRFLKLKCTEGEAN
tara:strand:+ start:100 stop:426 length:327 start_codon:yes stop_codon:yes gene_type:complete